MPGTTPSGLPSLNAVCPAINSQLINLAENSPQTVRQMNGTLLALRSESNRAGVRMQVPVPQDGKLQPVQIMFGQRGLASDIVTTETPCVDWSGATQPNNFAETITPDQFYFAESLTTYDVDQMRELCEADSSWMARQINAQLDALAQVINTQSINSLAAAFGNYSSGTNSGTSPASLALIGTIATNVESPQPVKWTRGFTAETMRLRYAGQPIVIGFGDLNTYMGSINGGGINMGGVNISAAGNVAYYADNAVETTLAAANYFISMQPGAAQLVTQNRFVGDYLKNAGDFFQFGTIFDPVTNLTYDLYVYFDPNCQQYKVQISLHYLPYPLFADSSVWQVGDPLYGNTFIHQWNAA